MLLRNRYDMLASIVTMETHHSFHRKNGDLRRQALTDKSEAFIVVADYR